MKDRMHKLALAMIIALVLSPLYPAVVHADFINIYGNTSASTEHLGNFTATFNYTSSANGSAVFEVSLTNTSIASNGGYLTGFAFNNPDNQITGVRLASDNAKFKLLGTSKKGIDFQNGINAQPFGYFDIGAALGGSFEGGGKPKYGIPVGGTEIFYFTLTGNSLDTLNESSFVGGNNEFFVARFKGFEDGGSDKVPASPVPLPPSVYLLGSGLLGLGLVRKRVK